MTRGAFVLTLFLLSSACSVDDGDVGYRPTRAESNELLAICEQHEGGKEFSAMRGGPADAACPLMVGLVGGLGTNCADFAQLKASWEQYLTEGGESYGDCSNLR